MISDIQYIFFINPHGEDFITTSFTNINDIITIFNFSFDKEIDITELQYVAIDYALDPFVSFNKKYTNSRALLYYEVNLLDQDIDRMMIRFRIINTLNTFDLISYKRDIKIGDIINENSK